MLKKINWVNTNINLNDVLNFAGQEENLYAKKNYDKYLSALKNSGLVSVEDKTHGSTADGAAGAEGGAGAMVLLGKIALTHKMMHSYFTCYMEGKKSFIF